MLAIKPPDEVHKTKITTPQERPLDSAPNLGTRSWMPTSSSILCEGLKSPLAANEAEESRRSQRNADCKQDPLKAVIRVTVELLAPLGTDLQLLSGLRTPLLSAALAGDGDSYVFSDA